MLLSFYLKRPNKLKLSGLRQIKEIKEVNIFLKMTDIYSKQYRPTPSVRIFYFPTIPIRSLV